MATTTYILNAAIGFGLLMNVSYIGASVISIFLVALFFYSALKARAAQIPLEEDISGWRATAAE
ncbi:MULTISPECIES: hypothetical protein [unclassified Sporosarcina]|uniref:hypothetical protein n=1 Tax=unclassified Sporosarcina TaxID=2647733 RepID=UPI00203F4083|nr:MULTISPECIES: hypothetical protein [unclassified Sporosarcina]GKV64530.1 hypothetical protein NCCP2331_06830 [Sporosarcina sp. NCCP-2331]GLB54597.1 hypothetical protein NCCP2378_03820 [Sporosarcina sp. NCCP-2378]